MAQARTAIKIQGRDGRSAFINDTYEPMQILHNDKPCWVARGVASRYIFHTGKSRWAISKVMDDGSRCWAYVPATGDDPSTCPGPWVMHDGGDEWNPDPKVTCASAAPSTDKFVQLRMTLDSEMRNFGLIEPKDLKRLWRKLDYNGNNIVSLAEIDKMVVEQVSGGSWPEWLNNKPALMRAYKKTILKDGDGDSWVEKKEFHDLLLNIFWFNKLWKIFDAVDSGDDRRIDSREFCAGLGQLGLSLSQDEALQEFAMIDRNNGGQVLFVEFCAYIRKRVNPDANPEFDADIVSGVKCGKNIRQAHGSKATQAHYVTKKCFRDFDRLEARIQSIIKSKKRLLELWKRLDFNGNNIVSLAEIDKLMVEKYPLLNHKPALMRAYKQTIKQGDGDDWVQKREFKSLLANLFYFNKIFWVYDQVDGDKDRRLDFKEFRKVLNLCGSPMNEAQAKQEFQQVDRNGGGIILFDEFCRYFTSKKCPESMSDLVD